jgi:hypothetical protein
VLATAALTLGLAAPAPAQLPPNNGGVDQYVAPVPDSKGDRPANPRHEGGDPSRLPPSVRASLPPGGEGQVLGRLATDPGSGAPADAGGATGGSGDRDRSGGGGAAGGSGGGGSGGGGIGTTGGTEQKNVTAASAITSSISDDPAVAVTVAAIIALTLAAMAVAFARRQRREN